MTNKDNTSKTYTIDVIFESSVVLRMSKDRFSDDDLKERFIKPKYDPFTYLIFVDDVDENWFAAGFSEHELLRIADQYKAKGWIVKKNTQAINHLTRFSKPEKELKEIVEFCNFSMYTVIGVTPITYLLGGLSVLDASCFLLLSLAFIYKIKTMVKKAKQVDVNHRPLYEVTAPDCAFVQA